jgi:hypothetical protein
MVMLRRRSNSARFTLTAEQRRAIAAVAQGLAPNHRFAFTLHVSRVLALAQPSGFPTDALVQRAIARALAEVSA